MEEEELFCADQRDGGDMKRPVSDSSGSSGGGKRRRVVSDEGAGGYDGRGNEKDGRETVVKMEVGGEVRIKTERVEEGGGSRSLGKEIEVKLELQSDESDYEGDDEFASLSQAFIQDVGDEVDAGEEEENREQQSPVNGSKGKGVKVELYEGDRWTEQSSSNVSTGTRVKVESHEEDTRREQSMGNGRTEKVVKVESHEEESNYGWESTDENLLFVPQNVKNNPVGQNQPMTPISAQPSSRTLEAEMGDIYEAETSTPQLPTPLMETIVYKTEYDADPSSTESESDSFQTFQTPLPKRREHPRSVIPVLHPRDRKTSSRGEHPRSVIPVLNPRDKPTSSEQPVGDMSNSYASASTTGSQRVTVQNVTESRRANTPQEELVHVPVPAGQFLTFYEMEEMYQPEDKTYTTDRQNAKARRQWLAKLDIDVRPYWARQTKPHQRAIVEKQWAVEHHDKRQTIEKTAIKLKYYVDIEVPVRIVPTNLIGEAPLSFARLEEVHFNIPARKTAITNNKWRLRNRWLKDLSLHDTIYYSIEHNKDDLAKAETLYANKPILERRAIQAKAMYLNTLLDPIARSWTSFETTYRNSLPTSFENHTDWQKDRAIWLELLDLKRKPFLWLHVNNIDEDLEACDVEWATLNDAHRKSKEVTAEAIKIAKFPALGSWCDFESIYGLVSVKDTVYKESFTAYQSARKRWLKDIELHFEPFLSAGARNPTLLQNAWVAKVIDDRMAVLKRAEGREEKTTEDLVCVPVSDVTEPEEAQRPEKQERSAAVTAKVETDRERVRRYKEEDRIEKVRKAEVRKEEGRRAEREKRKQDRDVHLAKQWSLQ